MRHRSLFAVAAVVLPSLAGMVLAAPAPAPARADAALASSSPRAAVEIGQAWVGAVSTGDVVTACSLMTPQALAEFTARGTTCEVQLGFFTADPKVKADFARFATSIDPAAVVVVGSRASLPLTEPRILTLDLTGSGWRVSLLS